MSAQAKQFGEWAAGVNYPLVNSGTLPTNAILDVRGFSRIPLTGGLTLLSISGTEDMLLVHFELSTEDGVIPLEVPVDTADLISATSSEVTASCNYDSPYLSSAGFLLAGITVTFGPGILGLIPWTSITPLEIEGALIVDLSAFSIYRLRVRQFSLDLGGSPLVDVGGVITLKDGYNVSVIPDPDSNRVLLDADRGFGVGIHQRGWPYGEDLGDCAGFVVSINGAPAVNNLMKFEGKGGIEIFPTLETEHSLTIRIARTSQTGTKC